MKRIFSDYAYSDAPRAGCWWDETCEAVARPAPAGDLRCDVAIIGGGFTGVSAALHLAQAGVSAAVLESRYVGWGASGRNGGFCCLGGGKLDDAALTRAVGAEGCAEWRQTEVASVRFVEGLIAQHGLDVDRHSQGETQLAHRPQDLDEMRREADQMAQTYGFQAQVLEAGQLEDAGLSAGFHGAMTLPVGFALNPRKYITGLAAAAEAAGAQIYHQTPVTRVTRQGDVFQVQTPQGVVTADRVIIGTNGYSSEDVPPWLAGRYIPTQSNIIVTRPLTQSELGAQGWTSGQACYDTRHLLHYFRLMPDNRMLFGLRGGLRSSPAAQASAERRARRDFDRMFPAWRGVQTTHSWSGMVCVARNQMPFVGEVPQQPGMFASLCYHGNGVAMASYAGGLLADLVQGKTPAQIYPQIVQRPLRKFELGRFRRALMPLAYARYGLADR